MKILRTTQAFLSWRRKVPEQKTIGFVPTMGALHSGHLSLIQASRRENDLTVVSIFINPSQFGPKEDFEKYPRTERDDLILLRSAGIDAVFIPSSKEEIYRQGSDTWIVPRTSLTEIMEGRFRPNHFKGVATVVLKLFSIVNPRRAYFGEKDYQQLRVIETMVEDLFLPVSIRRCATKRASSGLALSSRNRYLTELDRKRASLLYQTLKSSPDIASAKRRLRELGFKLQYLEAWDEDFKRGEEKNSSTKLRAEKRVRWFVAAYFQGVRLIDNLIRSSQDSRAGFAFQKTSAR